MVRRQAELEGMERKAVKEVDDAAEGYCDVRDRRMKLTKKEKAAKDALIVVMKKHNLTVYRDDNANPPVLVTLSSKDDVTVRAKGDDEQDESEAEAVN